MSRPGALEMRDVSLRFGGQVVLRDFSICLKAGEKALLTGPSGCGKSTVLRCLLGFTAPESGSIFIEGQQFTPDTVWSLRQRMAYVGQEPDLGSGTVREAVQLPFFYRANASLRDNLRRVPELFDRFGLARQLLDKNVNALSGGEKQRVALVSAILLDRPILLLDEITSALDKASKLSVADYLRGREDATMLIVAHDPEVFSFVDRAVELHCATHAKDAT